MGTVKTNCSLTDHRTLKLAVSHKEINGINWFWYVDINSGKLKVVLDPHPKEGPIKSLLSVCLSNSSAFSSGMAH